MGTFDEFFAGEEILRSFVDDLELGVGFGVGEDFVMIFWVETNVAVAGIPVVEGAIHETGFVALLADGEVVFSDVSGEISGLAKLGGVGFLPSFGRHGGAGVEVDPVASFVLAGEVAGARRGADGAGDGGIIEDDGLGGELVEVGSFDESVSVNGEGILALVIGEDEDDVGSSCVNEGGEEEKN